MSLQEKVRQLFLLDQQLRGMRGRLDAATQRLARQEAKVAQLNRQRGELGEQLKQAQVKAAALEHQTKDFDQRVERLREQMNSVKSNKEYSALLMEVSTLKAEKSKLEDQALEHLTRVDEFRAQVADVEAKLQEQHRLVAVAQAEVAQARAEVGAQVDELTAKRAQAEQEIPVEARATFRKLADVHEGEVMAAIVEENRRTMEYSCGGCYMGLPVERVSSAMRKTEELVCCPSCGRILYMDQDLKASMSK